MKKKRRSKVLEEIDCRNKVQSREQNNNKIVFLSIDKLGILLLWMNFLFLNYFPIGALDGATKVGSSCTPLRRVRRCLMVGNVNRYI